MASEDIAFAQEDFLRKGGLYVDALQRKWKSGELQRGYEYHEYPKMIRLLKGTKTVERSTETIDKKTMKWTETVDVYDDQIAYNEDDEERILAGGKPSAAAEEERQALIARCRVMGLKVDRNWSALRLKRELGDKLDAPEPTDELEVLREKMARLEEIAALKAQIARMEGGFDEASDLRGQLTELGIAVDNRWGVPRLRSELEKATAPG